MHIVNAMFAKGLGGIEQAFLDYCLALDMQGNRVTAIIHPEAAIKGHLLSIPGLTIISLKNSGQWDILAKRRLRKLLKTQRPDAIIAHGNRAVSLLRPAAKKLCPVVGITHNYSTERLTKLDAVFALTGDLQQQLLSQEVAAERIFRIPNMIRLPRNIEPRPFHSPPVIGTMGRFVAKKGFDSWIRSLVELQRSRLSFNAIIGGRGEEETNLKQMEKDTILINTLKFVGWVEDKRSFFESIDIFCLPSLHEPFGIVLLEAMAHGVPVITTDSEGPSEIITPGQDALLVPKDDPKAMAAALKKLLTNPAFARKIAEGGLATVRQKYDIQVVSNTIQQSLTTIVQRYAR